MAREHGADSRANEPVRTCVGCRVRAPKLELLRVVVGGSEGGAAVVPDLPGSAPGRGAYLHPDPACLELATRRRAFVRALRVRGPLDEGPLRAHLEHAAGHPC